VRCELFGSFLVDDASTASGFGKGDGAPELLAAAPPVTNEEMKSLLPLLLLLLLLLLLTPLSPLPSLLLLLTFPESDFSVVPAEPAAIAAEPMNLDKEPSTLLLPPLLLPSDAPILLGGGGGGRIRRVEGNALHLQDEGNGTNERVVHWGFQA